MKSEGSCVGTKVLKLCGVESSSSACAALPLVVAVSAVPLAFPLAFLPDVSGGTTYQLNDRV